MKRKIPDDLKRWVMVQFSKCSAPAGASETANDATARFVVQHVFQNAPYGQMSQPVSITVRG